MSDPRERSQPITNFAFLFFACLLLCGMAIAAPSIALSKKSGPPTSGIRVSGRGFEPNVGVDIYFDTKDEALVITNGKGEFDNAKIFAPRSARPGKHWVTALERNDDKGAQKPFLVQTDWNQFHFDADGTRLNPYENVLDPKNVVNLSVKWIYHLGEPNGSSPAVVDGVLYVAGGPLYVIDAHTGTLLWSYVVNGSGVPPAVAQGIVYFGSSDDNVYALNAQNGAPLWTFKTGAFVSSSPTVVAGVVYVGSGDGKLYALNARSGTKLWSYTTGGYVSSPIATDGVVYFGSSDYNVYAVNAGNGALLWSYKTGNFAGNLAVMDGAVYATSQDDNIYALSARDGSLLWRYNTGSPVYSCPAVANGVVYVSSDKEQIYALNAFTGAELWSFATYDTNSSSPAVANGVVYVGSDDANMYALDARTGRRLWSYETGDVVPGSPTVVNGVLYFSSYDTNVYAFSLTGDGQAKQEGASPPALTTLRRDVNLKVVKPDAIP
jgi:outer membrane protein assembly factor BamB